MIAATRLTTDSIASDSKPTEPVSHQAKVFNAIVTTAAAMDSQAYRVSDERSIFEVRPMEVGSDLAFARFCQAK